MAAINILREYSEKGPLSTSRSRLTTKAAAQSDAKQSKTILSTRMFGDTINRNSSAKRRVTIQSGDKSVRSRESSDEEDV